MRKCTIVLTTMLLCFITSFAQDSGKIKGSVRDNNGKPLQSASVSLLRLSDSSLVKAVATSKDGNYEFENVRAGEYIVAVTSVGYDKKLSASFAVGAGDVNVPAVQMNESPKGMAGVTVTAKRPFIETRIDKTVVNVEASPTSAGATAMEVLEKSPGISVNNDGVISLRGKSGVIVLMDGKPTYLSAADLANMLKNMPASALDQIEIMTNPSSKYDAEGNSGVINIKTKKGRAGGFNGSLMTSWTLSSLIRSNDAFYVFPQTQNSFTFNYRKNKLNFFGNYNPNFFRGGAMLDITRRRLNQQLQTEGYNDVETEFKFGNNNHTLKLGLDYQADKKNSYGIVVSGFTFSGHPTPRTTTTIADANHNPTLIMESQTNNRNKFQNLTTNVNYRHQFDSTGRELTADFDFITYNNTSRVLLTTDFFDGNGQPFGDQLLLKGYIPGHINIYSFKSDYVHPLKKGGRIEAGLKSSFVKNNNEVDYVRWDNVKWVADARSNHFIYDENINAVYVNANKQFGKWSLQGGLRLENTNAKGYQVTNDSTFKRDFTNLFPSAFISREVNKSNTLTLSYTRRITRPNYQDLNPFIWFLDSLSYRKGNPFLMPQFTHNIELSHSFKGKLITTVNYNSTNDVIAQILKPDGNIVYLTSDNVARFRNYGLAVTLNTPLTKWWNLNLFSNVFNNYYSGMYEGKPIEFSYTAFMVNMTQTFTVKKYNFEINGFYRSKSVEQLSIAKPMYVLNFGGSKNIMNGKGTLRFNLRDPFWLQKYRGITQYDVVDTKVENKWDNRRLTVSFTWRFGKTNQQAPPPRRRNNATQDEQNRVGSGQ